MWAERAETLAHRMIKHFWDADAGVFWAMRDHQPIKSLTPFNLYPLWTGRLPKEMNDGGSAFKPIRTSSGSRGRFRL